MAKLDELLRLMRQHKASDIHLSSGSAPYLRVHGEMVKLNYREVAHEVCQSLIFQILTEKQQEIFAENLELDFSYPLPEVGRFRVNVFMQRKGIAAVFRLIPEKAHDACLTHTLDQHLRTRAHYHHRRPDRVRPRERQGAHQPARSLQPHQVFPRRPARRAPRRP